MEDIETIKVELTEENLIKPKRIEFENGSYINFPVDVSEENYGKNHKIIFWD